MNPHDFVARWAQSTLREQQGAQSHFNELCQLVNHPTPTQRDPEGTFFTFEENVTKSTGGRGRADVWYKGRFAWEYKGKGKSLDEAYAQLLSYKTDLDNPPLLVVCDFDEYRIYPQWPNVDGQPIVFRNADLLKPEYRRFIDWLLIAPEEFLKYKQDQQEQRRVLTEELARKFADLARSLETDRPADEPAWTQQQIARFLMRIMFILFAEDTGLLPLISGVPTFRYILSVALDEKYDAFVSNTRELFEAMNGQRGRFAGKAIPYFNGGLFDLAPDEGGQHQVIDILKYVEAVSLLQEAHEKDWSKVNPTIFGTLFERALDDDKRGQLGAHYTSEADIRLILDPVLMQPVIAEWDAVRAEAEPLMQRYLDEAAPPRAKAAARDRLTALHTRMADRLTTITVLDPACGSGNFLYLSLRLLKDLEGRVHDFFAPLGLPFHDWVTPRQFFGIEKEPFAARLAQVVVWIGYLQWRYDNEGGLRPVLPHQPRTDHSLNDPILGYIGADQTERIVNADAVLRYRDDGTPYEPDWPPAEVIVGNPPFLGGNRIRGELGGYVDHLFGLYAERVPAFADLVCYWFEKARAQIAAGKTRRAGLIATNSIRGGANREVLKRIKESGDIFMAWSDREWILDGAAVRVSMVGFDDGKQTARTLDGQTVEAINPDLSHSVNVVQAKSLSENANISFQGPSPKGQFDISEQLALQMLAQSNPSGEKNSDVVKRTVNGQDLVRNGSQKWTIDFGTNRDEEIAKKYIKPYEYLLENVFPIRAKNNRETYRQYWWLYAEARPGMRTALGGLKRYIVTPRVAKHRILVWLSTDVLADDGTIVFAREDDYFFGVLHSYPHELWSLRQGTWLGKGNDPRYTPTTTFETFPLPWSPGQEDTASPVHAAISAAAAALHAERDAWLNPPDLIALGGDVRDRTLTKLYNALEDLRAGKAPRSADDPAVKFAPRLRHLHDALDAAVLASYGWDDLIPALRTSAGDEELLRRLLALNRARAEG